MGIFDQSSLTKQNPATVLLSGFQVRCTLHSIGMMQTFLNDEPEAGSDAASGVRVGVAARQSGDEHVLAWLYVRKDQCHMIAFEQMFSQEETGLMPRVEALALYTSDYVLQGKVHLGTEDQIHDFIVAGKSYFIGMTDVAIFPLFELQTAMIQQAPLVFVYRNAVRMHHPV